MAQVAQLLSPYRCLIYRPAPFLTALNDHHLYIKDSEQVEQPLTLSRLARCPLSLSYSSTASVPRDGLGESC